MSNLIATKRSDLLDHYLKLDQGGAIQAECEWILHGRFLVLGSV